MIIHLLNKVWYIYISRLCSVYDDEQSFLDFGTKFYNKLPIIRLTVMFIFML